MNPPNDIFQSIIDYLSYYLVLGGIIFILFLVLGLLVWGLIIWYRWRNREEESLNSSIFEVLLPKDNETKIEAMEQIFASLASLYRGGRFSFLKHQTQISFEIVGKPEDIRFYFICPNKIKELVARQIYSAYPTAELEETEEYNIFYKKGKVVFSWLVNKKENYKPIKTYRELGVDPLSAITSALAKLKENEGAVIQIILAPANSKWQAAGKSYLSSIKKAESDPQKAAFKVSAQFLEAIENKCSKPGFETTIRIVTVAATESEAKSHLSNIKTAFAQFQSPWNEFTSKKIRFKYGFMIDFIYRYQPIFWGLSNKKTILNSEELASIFHFPNKMIETPEIRWLKAKRAPAANEVPLSGLYLGKNIYRGVVKPIYISHEDRRRHIYIIGKTGTGKTELLKELILQDIRAGRGICLIDPHDLAEEILEFIPPERAENVIYFDPSNLERPMGLNLLEAKTEDQKHFVATAVINLMYKLYDPYKTGIIGQDLSMLSATPC